MTTSPRMGWSCGYARKSVLNSVTFTLNAGALTAILGPNGCGKTTLLKTLARLLPRSAVR